MRHIKCEVDYGSGRKEYVYIPERFAIVNKPVIINDGKNKNKIVTVLRVMDKDVRISLVKSMNGKGYHV